MQGPACGLGPDMPKHPEPRIRNRYVPQDRRCRFSMPLVALPVAVALISKLQCAVSDTFRHKNSEGCASCLVSGGHCSNADFGVFLFQVMLAFCAPLSHCPVSVRTRVLSSVYDYQNWEFQKLMGIQELVGSVSQVLMRHPCFKNLPGLRV